MYELIWSYLNWSHSQNWECSDQIESHECDVWFYYFYSENTDEVAYVLLMSKETHKHASSFLVCTLIEIITEIIFLIK